MIKPSFLPFFFLLGMLFLITGCSGIRILDFLSNDPASKRINFTEVFFSHNKVALKITDPTGKQLAVINYQIKVPETIFNNGIGNIKVLPMPLGKSESISLVKPPIPPCMDSTHTSCPTHKFTLSLMNPSDTSVIKNSYGTINSVLFNSEPRFLGLGYYYRDSLILKGINLEFFRSYTYALNKK